MDLRPRASRPLATAGIRPVVPHRPSKLPGYLEGACVLSLPRQSESEIQLVGVQFEVMVGKSQRKGKEKGGECNENETDKADWGIQTNNS